jgi:MFS transporter, DHA1 family, tetracycline resistance protein
MNRRSLSRNLILIYILVVIDSSIAAMVLPIQPQIFARFAPNIASFLVSISNALFRLTQLFSAPFLGHLTDKWGRKPVFLLATTGTFFSYLIMLPLNIPALFANRLLDGSSNGFYTAVRSAITDISTKKKLARNLGLLSSLAAIGLVVGPAFSATLGLWDVQFLPSRNITLIVSALFLALINITIASIITETKPVNKNIKQQELLEFLPEESENPIITERFNYRNLIPDFLAIWKTNRQLGYLIVMELLMVSVLTYYFYFISFVSYSKLQFNTQDIAIFMVYFGGVIALIHFSFFKFLNHKINPKKMIIFGVSMGVLVLSSYAFVTQKWMLYALVPLDIISVSLLDGLIQGMIGKLLPENKRGSINGLIQGFSGIVAFVSPVIAAFLSYFGVGLPFFWFAFCLIFVGGFALKLKAE